MTCCNWRAAAGRALAKEPVDVSAVLEETVPQARQLDAQREIQVQVDSGLQILGDKDALKEILLIALDNALKHSTSKIDVSAHQQGSLVEIRVQDFGEGIPAEKLERIFDRFYRGYDAATIQGFGLGLPIAKALTDAQSGEIKVESEMGKGSTVIVRFPKYACTS
jgi:signal transduction histidine kinase